MFIAYIIYLVYKLDYEPYTCFGYRPRIYNPFLILYHKGVPCRQRRNVWWTSLISHSMAAQFLEVYASKSYSYIIYSSAIMTGFHGSFATGEACQQGTLTTPDTWFRPPLWDLLVLQLLRPDSSNLPCLYSTFHHEYPLVLYWFRFFYLWNITICPPE